MKKNVSKFEFFDLVLSGDYGQLDILNYIQLKTDNYQQEKLRLLIGDIEYCKSCEREEIIEKITKEQIDSAIKQRTSNNREIPYIYFKELRKNGEIVIPESKSLDLEALLFPFHFFRINQLLEMLKSKLEIQTVEPHSHAIANPDKKPDKLRELISQSFEWMLEKDLRQKQVIITKSEFEKLVSWVNFYFKNNFIIPEISNPIKKHYTNKGNIVYAFKELFDGLHPSKPRPDSLYNLIKGCFYEHRDDKISNYQKLKEPANYKAQVIQKF